MSKVKSIINMQIALVMNLLAGLHYFCVTSRQLITIITLWPVSNNTALWQRHLRIEDLPMVVVTWKCHGWELTSAQVASHRTVKTNMQMEGRNTSAGSIFITQYHRQTYQKIILDALNWRKASLCLRRKTHCVLEQSSQLYRHTRACTQAHTTLSFSQYISTIRT